MSTQTQLYRTIRTKNPTRLFWGIFLSIFLVIYSFYQGHIPCRIPRYLAISVHHNNQHYEVKDRTRFAHCPSTNEKHRVQYIAYSVGDFEVKYTRNLEILECAASRQGVPFLLLNPYDYKECEHLHDVFFLRHCVTAQFLKCADYTFTLDLDVIPQHEFKWEDYLTDYDLVFSQSLEGNEIAAGTFLVKNTEYSKQFLLEWSEYEHWQKCWNANGDQNPLHHLLLNKVNVPDREKAECLALMDKQKWDYQVIQWIRCAVWWIRVGSQWSTHIYITDMSEALTITVRDYAAEQTYVDHSIVRTGIPLPFSHHPFIHGMKPAVMDGFLDWNQWTNCSAVGETWTLPWFHVTKVTLSYPPFPRGFRPPLIQSSLLHIKLKNDV